MKRLIALLLMLILVCGGCAIGEKRENVITLSDDEIMYNGEVVGESGDVFVSRDIIYYEQKEKYESGYPYGEGTETDMHSASEAGAHRVLNITKSGVYRISGKLKLGQIRVDLGEDAKKDESAVAKLILDNADMTSTVAPAILFMNVYECDSDWDTESATPDVDTSGAGAVLVLADGSINNVTGSYVEKIFKDADGEKKLWKQDGAIYSYMSMNIEGDGELNVLSDNEGIDTELHLTINGGDINVYSENDGINTNEDGVSVTTINGGNVKIIAGLGDEGDGIDSNGYLVINGGNVLSCAKPVSDSGLDSSLGSYINGGTVVSLGSTMDWPESDSEQVTVNLQFNEAQAVDSEITIKDREGKVVFEYNLEKEEHTDGQMRDFRGAVISSPELRVGDEYTVYINGVKMGYTGTDFKMGPGGHHGKPPEGMNFPEGERPEPPEGERPPKHPEGAEGMVRPPMGDRNHNVAEDGAEQKDVFVMQDKVNRFSGVADKK